MKDEIDWLHRFLNASVFGPPPSEIQRAHEIVDRLVSPEAASADAERYRYLKTFAMPRYIVLVKSGDTASLYREEPVTVVHSSWDELDRALDNSRPSSSQPQPDQESR